ncbi:MAG: NAD-dependent epimerase/dehydratase family protein [Candidatus Omnitrophica bacterium]|nr:NAD-dependent epimerase/dehydratase family protein [Candidatus Omnitrophota bacterium]
MAAKNQWHNRRVLLTGGTGFIGANLVRRLLAEKATVFVMSRNISDAWRLEGILDKITMISGDLSCFADIDAALAKSKPSTIFHLATARVSEDPTNFPLFISINTLGAHHLMTAAKNAGVETLVYAGSQLEYGQSNRPHLETDRLEPDTFHGLTKAAATLFFQATARQTDFSVAILRLFHVYGPWESPKRLIPTATRAVLNETTLRMTQKGIRRDYVYVDDVVEAFLMAAERPDLKGEVFNIASGTQTLNEDIVMAIERHTGKRLVVEFDAYPPRPTDTIFRVADIEKAKTVLGWHPQFDLDKGLCATIDWLSKYDRGHRKK